MSRSSQMVHRAKVDGWLAGLLGGMALLEFVAGVVLLVTALAGTAPGAGNGLIVGPILMSTGALFVLILWACSKIRYEVTATELVVHSGPFGLRLPLSAIVEVFPTHNPLSAPAPSLDRLRINYRRPSGRMWFALISPQDKAAFVRDLAVAAPHLHSGDEPLRLKGEAPTQQ